MQTSELIDEHVNSTSRFVSFWMSLRYLQLKKMHYGSFISWVSIFGLGLGVAILIVVLSVMNGFDEELSERILGSVPHLVLYPEDQSEPQTYPSGVKALTNLPGVTDAFRFFQAEGIITRNSEVNAVAVYGVPSGQKVPLVSDNMVQGSLSNEAQSLVMGAPLARYLGLRIQDSVALILTAPTQYGVKPEIRRFTLTGLFEVGAELDYSVVVVNYVDIVHSNLQSTGKMGIRLVLDDPYLLSDVRAKLPPVKGWQIRDWTEDYGELFRAVKLEKRMMFLLLLLIVTVAIFNVVAGQTMVVNEKRADIAILRTMGATSKHILQLFLLQGTVISLLGIAFGLSLGILLASHISDIVAYLEAQFGVSMLEGTYFQTLPSSLQVSDLLIITGLAFLLCMLSAYGPAKRAASLNPTDSLG